jgi:hypothetical protein
MLLVMWFNAAGCCPGNNTCEGNMMIYGILLSFSATFCADWCCRRVLRRSHINGKLTGS